MNDINVNQPTVSNPAPIVPIEKPRFSGIKRSFSWLRSHALLILILVIAVSAIGVGVTQAHVLSQRFSKLRYGLADTQAITIYNLKKSLTNTGQGFGEFISNVGETVTQGLEGGQSPQGSLTTADSGIYAQYLPIPTLGAFSTNLYFGAASLGYPIYTPPGPGGFAPQVSLSYSSSGIDDFMNFTDTNRKRWFIRQSGPVGLGWGISGGSYGISIDQNGQNDPNDSCKWRWHISFPGGSAELLKVDDDGDRINRCKWSNSQQDWIKNDAWTSGTWTTDPELFIKIIRTPGGYNTGGDEWEIKTADNTGYIFGDVHEGVDTTRVTSTLHFWLQSDVCLEAGGQWHADIIPISWKLREIKNSFDETITYDYEAFRGSAAVDVPDPYASCGAFSEYVGRAEIKEVSYGQNKIKFSYNKTREDWRIVKDDEEGGYVYEDRTNLHASQNDNAIASTTDKAIDTIKVEVNGTTIKTYKLTYYDAWEQRDIEEDGGKVYGIYRLNDDLESFHLTLKSIQEFGRDGLSEQPAHFYTYQMIPFYLEDENDPEGIGDLQNRARNSLYIKTAYNGYDSGTTYTFGNSQEVVERCDHENVCEVNNQDAIAKAKIKKTRNDIGNGDSDFWETVYTYPTGTRPLVYAPDIPGDDSSIHPEGNSARFLGYPDVKVRTYPKNVETNPDAPPVGELPHPKVSFIKVFQELTVFVRTRELDLLPNPGLWKMAVCLPKR